jgi:hypothetical protein
MPSTSKRKRHARTEFDAMPARRAVLGQVHRRHGWVVLGDGSDLRAAEPEHGADRLRFGAVDAQDPDTLVLGVVVLVLGVVVSSAW